MTVTTITDLTPKSRAVYKLDADWATARNAAVGTATQTSTWYVGVVGGYIVYHGYLIFDTSVIPAGAVISAAKLRLWLASINNTPGSALTCRVLNGMPTYPHDPVVVADYDRTLYAGAGGDHSYKNDAIGGYVDHTLNATGIGWINRGGSTKFNLQNLEYDINNVDPGGGGNIKCGFSNLVGNEPKLEITWTLPTGCGPALRFPLKQVPVHNIPLG